jgi:Mg2+/Co2+ transporter CorC
MACDEVQSMLTQRYTERFSMVIVSQCSGGVVPTLVDISNLKVISLNFNDEFAFKERTNIKAGDTIIRV